jgi:hypothetical protein
MHRFYALAIAPTLFGEWTLTVEWGRIGSAGMVHRHTFDDEARPDRQLCPAALAGDPYGANSPAREQRPFGRSIRI